MFICEIEVGLGSVYSKSEVLGNAGHVDCVGLPRTSLDGQYPHPGSLNVRKTSCTPAL